MKDRMAFFNGRCLFCGIGFSCLLNMSGTSFWISAILGTIIGVLILLLIKECNNYKFTKVITGTILAIMSSTILVNMGHSLYLKNTPVIVLTLFAVIGAFIISKSEKKALTKVLYILFAYTMFLFVSKNLSLAAYAKPENLYPMFQTEFTKIIVAALAFALTGVVPIICLNDLTDKKNIVMNYIISMITVISVGFLVVSVIGIKGAMLYRYPEYVVLKRIKILNFISNVDNIFTFGLVIDLLMTTAASFRTVDLKGKFSQYVVPVITTIASIYVVQQNWPILIVYRYYPFILLFLLIIVLIPKKRV